MGIGLFNKNVKKCYRSRIALLFFVHNFYRVSKLLGVTHNWKSIRFKGYSPKSVEVQFSFNFLIDNVLNP